MKTKILHLKPYRIKTADNPDGWLFIAHDNINAVALFMSAHPKEKSFTVVPDNTIDRLANLN